MDYLMKVLLFLFTIVAAGLSHSRVAPRETTQDYHGVSVLLRIFLIVFGLYLLASGSRNRRKYPCLKINMALADKTGRVALVTGGSIVTFKELIDEVLTPGFIAALADHGFTALVLQCGDYVDEVDKKVTQLRARRRGLEIRTFAWDANLLETMKLCRGEAGGRRAGVVISHAGTGTIGDCFKLNVAQVIVANFHLMDDHQTPFAPVIAREHANIVHGHLGKLANAVPQALEAIKELGLDELGPLGEKIFPVPEQDRITLIDQVIALD